VITGEILVRYVPRKLGTDQWPLDKNDFTFPVVSSGKQSFSLHTEKHAVMEIMASFTNNPAIIPHAMYA